jgi:hypothetical protein
MTMSDLIALVNQISTSVKVSWAVWLAWALIQIEWYRRGRSLGPVVSAPRTPFRPDRQQVLPLRSWSDSPIWESAGSADSVVKVTDVSMQMPAAESTSETSSEPVRRTRRSYQDAQDQMGTSESQSTEPMAHAS